MDASNSPIAAISDRDKSFREQMYSPILLLVLGIVMGAFLPITKAANQAGAQALSYAFWTSLGSGLAALCIALVCRVPIRVTSNHLPFYLVTGGAGVTGQLIAILVVEHIGAGLTGIMYMLPPLVTYVVAAAVRLEPLRLARASGIALGCVGTVLIIAPQASLPQPDRLHWLLFALAIPLVTGANLVYRSRAWPSGVNAFSVASSSGLSSAALVLPFAIIRDGHATLHVLTQPVAHWVMLHALLGSIALLIAMSLQRRAGPVYASQSCYVMTLTTMTVGAVFFDERFGGWVWIGLAFIAAGIGVSSVSSLPRIYLLARLKRYVCQ